MFSSRPSNQEFAHFPLTGIEALILNKANEGWITKHHTSKFWKPGSCYSYSPFNYQAIINLKHFWTYRCGQSIIANEIFRRIFDVVRLSDVGCCSGMYNFRWFKNPMLKGSMIFIWTDLNVGCAAVASAQTSYRHVSAKSDCLSKKERMQSRDKCWKSWSH